VNVRGILAAAALLAAAFLFLLWPSPSPDIVVTGPASPLTVAGTFHVHSNRSDGSGSPEEIAAAAAQAGLHFIVLTDHGDGTRTPDPPRYLSGVLVIDAVELSTQGGHYIALGLPQTPYPLRGEAHDVVEDVRRLGGFGIVAHPDSSKPSLQWRAWNAPFDAIEWLNADTEWRDEHGGHFLRALARYPVRPVDALASLLDRPERTLERWDALTRRRRVVAVAGADAHARAGWRDDDSDGYTQGWFLRIPSYEASFRTFATRVQVERPFGKDPKLDERQILASLRSGRVFTVIDAIGSPSSFDFSMQGSTLVARTNATGTGSIALRKDGRPVAEQPLPELKFETKGEPGTYRVEVVVANAPGTPPVPWIVSNPIYVHPEEWGTETPAVVPVPTISLSIQGGPWRVETDAASTARVSQTDPPKGPVEFSFRLGDGAQANQYAALVVGVGKALTDRTHLALRAQARSPMRVSIQARQPQSGERWQKSVYLDEQVRDVIVPLREMLPVGAGGTFDSGKADTLMLVLDLNNTNPGGAGAITIHDLRIER